MKILIAEDDAFSRKVLEAILKKADHEVVSCNDGETAIEAYKQDSSFEIAILDWMMPGKDGLEVCEAIKSNKDNPLTYVIMLTAKSSAKELAQALDSGADDFVSKPFNAIELNARINAGIRTIRLQKALMDNINELQDTLDHVDQLQGILPICAWCKKVRDDSGYWGSVEEYISKHSKAELSHSICPDCMAKYFPEIDNKNKTTENKEAITTESDGG
ncbi:MAG: response regulator transcription factor [candidate division Zixibacteria bacterium]|nr:response regulator transcription factor [candidate division Zixibacteria bacterium]